MGYILWYFSFQSGLYHIFQMLFKMFNGFHNSLMGHNTQFKARFTQGLNNSPPGIYQTNHKILQPARKSSRKIDFNSSEGPNGNELSLQKERPAAHRLLRKWIRTASIAMSYTAINSKGATKCFSFSFIQTKTINFFSFELTMLQ